MATLHTTGPCNVPKLNARDRALVEAAMNLVEAHKNRPSDDELLKIIREGYLNARRACFEAPFEHSPRDFENILVNAVLDALKTNGVL